MLKTSKWRPFVFAPNHVLHWSMLSLMMSCDMADHVSMRRCLNWLVSPTAVLYTCSCISPQTLWSTGPRSGLLGGHRSGWNRNVSTAIRHFRHCILEANARGHVLIVCAKYCEYAYWTMFDEITATQIWRVFEIHLCVLSVFLCMTSFCTAYCLSYFFCHWDEGTYT